MRQNRLEQASSFKDSFCGAFSVEDQEALPKTSGNTHSLHKEECKSDSKAENTEKGEK
jgi:hypothetical protein